MPLDLSQTIMKIIRMKMIQMTITPFARDSSTLRLKQTIFQEKL